jgi:hypothetical protein
MTYVALTAVGKRSSVKKKKYRWPVSVLSKYRIPLFIIRTHLEIGDEAVCQVYYLN